MEGVAEVRLIDVLTELSARESHGSGNYQDNVPRTRTRLNCLGQGDVLVTTGSGKVRRNLDGVRHKDGKNRIGDEHVVPEI